MLEKMCCTKVGHVSLIGFASAQPCSEMFALGSPFQWLSGKQCSIGTPMDPSCCVWKVLVVSLQVCVCLPCSTIWKKLDWGLKALVACIDLGTCAAPWVVWSVALLSSGIFHYSGYLHSLITLDSGELIHETVESWLYSDLIYGMF